MTELIITHKLDITSNMEVLANQILADIEHKYNFTVTENTVTDTKKLMSEINKKKDSFKKKYKEFKTLALEPFAPLDKKAKEIESYYDKARASLSEQVLIFEETKREQAKTACTEYAKEQCEAKGINLEAITISDLFNKLGSITETGNISGTAKKEIDQRIAIVENEILKAKLEAEEKAKRDREIAETARLETEEKAKQREIELLANAEIEKQEAIKKALSEVMPIKEVKTVEPADCFVNPEPQEVKEIKFAVTVTKEQLNLINKFLVENKIKFRALEASLCV